MKSEHIFCLIIVLIVLASIGVIFIHNSHYDKSCLENYAQSYCQSNNMTFSTFTYLFNDAGFSCKSNDLRIDNSDFHFIQMEVEGCRK